MTIRSSSSNVILFSLCKYIPRVALVLYSTYELLQVDIWEGGGNKMNIHFSSLTADENIQMILTNEYF